MSVLITGGMGFIGLHTVKAFVDAGEQVVATYRETWRPQPFLADAVASGQVVYEQADIGVPGVLVGLARKHQAQSIVHLAIHGRALPDPGDDLRINMDKLAVLLDAARHAGVRRITTASSSAIYFDAPAGPFHEDQPISLSTRLQPAAFKRAWEILSCNYADNYAASGDFELVTLRIGGVYGPLYRSLFNLPSRLVHAAVKGEAPDLSPERGGVPFAGDAVDMPYVGDVAEGIRTVHTARALSHRLYNLGTGAVTTNAQILAAVQAAVPGFEAPLQEGTGPRHRADAYMDTTRLTGELGWRPRRTLAEGIAAYADWLRAGNPF